VTLDDVARLSGVSRATASRAINGRPGVRDDVRQRVREVAELMGFRPNRAATNLASGRSSVIGFVIPSDELRVDPYGASMTHAVGRAATERDLGLMLHLARDEPGQTVHHILRDGMIDGLLISTVAIGRAWVDELVDSPLPTVIIGTHPTREVPGVDVENVESSALAVTHLFEQGCQRVGMITGPLDRADARARRDGFHLAHERAGRPVDECLVVEGTFQRTTGSTLAAQLVEAGVDGIFASNDETALGVIWTCSHLGLRVPHDVAVVGFDGTGIDELIEPSLTSVVQPFDGIDRAAVDALMATVDGRPLREPLILVPELAEGGSSIRAPKTSN
jgi:LacI family transcriptional regulator